MKQLESIGSQLDEWDGLVGDGDCGRTVAKGARVREKTQAVKQLDRRGVAWHDMAWHGMAWHGTE